MHKNPHQNAGNGIKETLFFKIFPGSMPPDPPRGSNSYPPPTQISKPVRLWFWRLKQVASKNFLRLFYVISSHTIHIKIKNVTLRTTNSRRWERATSNLFRFLYTCRNPGGRGVIIGSTVIVSLFSWHDTRKLVQFTDKRWCVGTKYWKTRILDSYCRWLWLCHWER